jgi:pyruvate-ferredoxin/flavodoxin oxidoreductase
LFRYEPARAAAGKNPLHLDSPEPSIPYRDFISTETRFNMLWRSHPDAAEEFLARSQQEVRARYHHYKQLADLPPDLSGGEADVPVAKPGAAPAAEEE